MSEDFNPRIIQCRYCGAKFLLPGAGTYTCLDCGEALTEDNIDEVFCYGEYGDDE